MTIDHSPYAHIHFVGPVIPSFSAFETVIISSDIFIFEITDFTLVAQIRMGQTLDFHRRPELSQMHRRNYFIIVLTANDGIGATHLRAFALIVNNNYPRQPTNLSIKRILSINRHKLKIIPRRH